VSDPRKERIAPPGAGFPKWVPVAGNARVAGMSWVRLAKVAYPGQFYPSLKSRLTPSSEKFPCVYLAPNAETAVAELFGDEMSLAKARGRKIYAINAAKADELAFLSCPSLPRLQLCDLTEADTRLALGLEAGSLYTSDLSIPQAWADMIAWHPNKYDGIIYRSRHTDEICLVLWTRARGRGLDKRVAFKPAGAFRNSAAAFEVARKIGIKLSFPGATLPSAAP
jgi:RES domain-containing protein